ncbi:hypothetical protein Ahy_A02g007535 [Arachis hypogaea]|uniref:Protein FAR1-RELATED SEQUENCE n=1 Tax=Arachis hypogaea TaxID=3818 RepID=A0A445ECX7_ARAHY|nr:hypothetical protein Ahy_A02g007535 [Arachis hypogaea]
MCIARYSLTDSNMLANLFCADGGSRIDYQHSGDVLSFDLTYKKNKYRIFLNMEIEKFEAKWDVAVEEYRLHDSFWVKETYDKRKMWTNAYLKDKFCTGFRTTSRCEWINTNVKKFLNSRHNVLEMVQNIELMVREYRNNELEAHFKSIHGNPVITACLDPLEQFATIVYTRELFLDVMREIEGVGAVNFVAKIR